MRRRCATGVGLRLELRQGIGELSQQLSGECLSAPSSPRAERSSGPSAQTLRAQYVPMIFRLKLSLCGVMAC